MIAWEPGARKAFFLGPEMMREVTTKELHNMTVYHQARADAFIKYHVRICFKNSTGEWFPLDEKTYKDNHKKDKNFRLPLNFDKTLPPELVDFKTQTYNKNYMETVHRPETSQQITARMIQVACKSFIQLDRSLELADATAAFLKKTYPKADKSLKDVVTEAMKAAFEEMEERDGELDPEDDAGEDDQDEAEAEQ